MIYNKIYKAVSLLIYPIILLMVIYLFQAFSSDDKMIRKELINRVLILAGLSYGLADLKKFANKNISLIQRTLKTNLLILFILLIITILIILKEGISFENSIVLGLISIIFGVASQINQLKDMIEK